MPTQPFAARTSHRTLMWALGLSVLLHAGLLTLKWASPATFDRLFDTQTLEVVLVNSRSNNAPDTAMALAQVNLAGGGQVPGTRMQSSPVSASKKDQSGQELQQVEKKIEALKNEQVRAVGNMKVNARGDVINDAGLVTHAKPQQLHKQYSQQVQIRKGKEG